MKEIQVIYFSSTGNTEAMAKAVAEGIEAAGGKAVSSEADGFNAGLLKEAESFALGCPACGSEELDQSMETLMDELSDSMKGKHVGLFGSYGWGDGEWMRDWENRVKEAGADIVSGSGVTVNGEPDEEILEQCRKLGKELV